MKNSISALLFAVALHVIPFVGLQGQKIPKPSQAELNRQTAVLRELYGQDYKAANTKEKVQLLADKIFTDAKATQVVKDRFSMLQTASNMAAQTGSIDMALSLIEEINRLFVIDYVQMKGATLSALSKNVSTEQDHKRISDELLTLVEVSLANGDVGQIQNLADFAFAEARKSKDAELQRSAYEIKQNAASLSNEYLNYTTSLKQLISNPNDASANFVAGRFTCYFTGNWVAGLPYLSKGSNLTLRNLALAELSNPADAAKQKEIGDSWWDIAENLQTFAQLNVRKRAVLWYDKALPSLAGLDKQVIEKRVSQVTSGGITGKPVSTGIFAQQPNSQPNPAIPPSANPASTAATTPQPLKDKFLTNFGWKTIFRSNNPNIWLKGNDGGESDFSLEYSKIPNSVKALRIVRTDTGELFIVQMTKETLKEDKDFGAYTWWGAGSSIYGKTSLGISDNSWTAQVGNRTQACISPSGASRRGWGWGRTPHGTSSGNVKCFGWNGIVIGGVGGTPLPVVEISVKIYDLSSYEQKFLIENFLVKR